MKVNWLRRAKILSKYLRKVHVVHNSEYGQSTLPGNIAITAAGSTVYCHRREWKMSHISTQLRGLSFVNTDAEFIVKGDEF